jgi:hypothetical protein
MGHMAGRTDKYRFMLSMIVALCSLPLAAHARDDLTVTISHTCENPYVVTLVVRNNSDAPINIATQSLPWSINTSSIGTEALIGPRYKKTLSASFPIADYFGATTTIAPHQSLKGHYDVRLRYPSISERESDVLVLFRTKDIFLEDGKRIALNYLRWSISFKKPSMFRDPCPLVTMM